MPLKPEGFQRIRTLTEALRLSDGDKRGPVLVAMDKTHTQQVNRAYVTEGASTGDAWKPLSPRYAAWKRKAYPGRKILVRTRETRARFIQPTDPLHIREYEPPMTYKFGAYSEIQWRHENGVGVGRQTLPVRPVVRKTRQDYAALVDTFRKFYISRVKQVLRNL